MYVLGLSSGYHDSAAALVDQDGIVAAAQEERFTRIKHDAGFPTHAIRYCLTEADIGPDDVQTVVMHQKPMVDLARVLAARQHLGPRGLRGFVREAPSMVHGSLFIGPRVERTWHRLGATRRPNIAYLEHHLSHAAAAFLPSPFRSAAILTVDGVGEWSTSTIGVGHGNDVRVLTEQRYPHSLGLLYSLFTYWCGFRPNDGEYKLMGLAPFGKPRFLDAIAEIADLGDDGSLTLSSHAPGWWAGIGTSLEPLQNLFEGPPRTDGPVGRREADLAASIQSFTESALLRMAHHAARLTGETNLVMAGGVALNCVANARLEREGPFERVWVQPAASDAGSALGAALLWRAMESTSGTDTDRAVDPTATDSMRAAQLGPSFSGDEVSDWLTRIGVGHRRLARDDLNDLVARRLASGSIVGWFEGRMEFGPRSLGHRAILADAADGEIHQRLNERVKGRESFRPFAPSVMAEHAGDWFDLVGRSPYMLTTAQVAQKHLCAPVAEPDTIMDRIRMQRSTIPACTHVDGSARVQTVERADHPLFWELLESFRNLTGRPLLLNTSFNLGGDPIVCTPDDALWTAGRANLDLLVIEDVVVDDPAGAIGR